MSTLYDGLLAWYNVVLTPQIHANVKYGQLGNLTTSVSTLYVKKVKRSDFSIALLTAAMPRPAALYNRRKWQLIGKSQWCGSAMLQLAYNTHHRPNQPHQAFIP